MSKISVRPRRLLGTAIQYLSLSLCIGTWPMAAHAELQGGTKTESLTGGTNQTTLTGGTNQTALTGGANQTAITGGTSSTSLAGTAAQTLLNGAAKVDALPANTNQNLLRGSGKSGLLPANANQTPLNGATKSGTLSGGTNQRMLNGNATTLTTGASHTPLQGGIKDDATLNPSLRLLKPATSRAGQPLAPGVGTTFIPGQVTQISGHTSSGPLAPVFQPSTAQPGVFQRTLGGTIAPISTYTMTRSNSRTWVAPGYEVTPANTSTSSAFVPPTSSSSSSSTMTQHGVTTWVPGYDVNSISQLAGSTISAIVGHGSGQGIAAYLPQYEVHKVTVTSPPMAYDPAALTQKGVTAFAPGYEVTVTSHNKGVVSWTPGYELSKLVPGAYKETLSGVWHSGSPTPALLASQGVLKQPQFTKVLVGPTPMVATGLLLPQLRAQVLEKLTWDEWYRRVARAIYCRWQYAEVGPGCATIRMVVTKDRDIGCQLIDFKPAPDIARDVAAEKLFRESAVKAVNMVTKFEIPDLPPLDSDKVVFDLDLKRVVDGPVGVDVAARK